jgi:hypothetical protein
VVDTLVKRRNLNAAQSTRVENAGVLTASGLIAGEALMGLLIAAVFFFFQAPWESLVAATGLPAGLARPLALAFMAVVGLYLILRPLARAGSPDEPAPPAVSM